MPDVRCDDCKGVYWWYDNTSKPLCNNCMTKEIKRRLI